MTNKEQAKAKALEVVEKIEAMDEHCFGDFTVGFRWKSFGSSQYTNDFLYKGTGASTDPPTPT